MNIRAVGIALVALAMAFLAACAQMPAGEGAGGAEPSVINAGKRF
jgi:hypothetical protein